MSVNTNDIEGLFKDSEHTKPLFVDNKLWERLEAKLDVDLHKKRSSYYRLISYITSVACGLLLFGLFIHHSCYHSDPKEFVLEELDGNQLPASWYNVDHIKMLNKNDYSCDYSCQPC